MTREEGQNMTREEFETVLSTILNAVQQQLITPMVLALGTLTVAATRDPIEAEWISSTLYSQAENCPPDLAGRAILLALAQLAQSGSSGAFDPQTLENSVREHLERLIKIDLHPDTET